MTVIPIEETRTAREWQKIRQSSSELLPGLSDFIEQGADAGHDAVELIFAMFAASFSTAEECLGPEDGLYLLEAVFEYIRDNGWECVQREFADT